MEYLNRAQMKDGGVYAIICRNAHVGVWREHCQGFIIPRNKFNNWYLFVEYHWDTGAPHGTAKPYQFIEDCPIEGLEVNKNSDEGLKYLMDLEEKAEKIIHNLQEQERVRVEKEDRAKADQMGIPYEKFEQIKALKYRENYLIEDIDCTQKHINNLNVMKSNGIESYQPEGDYFTRNVDNSLELTQKRLDLKLEQLEQVREELAQIRKELEDEKEG